MESSFRIIRVRGIDIGANWSWLFIFGFIIWSLSAGFFPSQYPGLAPETYWIMGITTSLLFVVSLLLHELGHALQALKEGMEIDGITLWLFGGVARFKGMFPTAGAEFRIAIAGPAVTAVLIVFFGAISYGLGQVGAGDSIVGVPAYLFLINIILLVFNMVPALPLDGGRVLRSILWQRRGNFTAATVSASRIARLFAGILIAFGVLMLLTPGTAFQGLWFALIGWFLMQAAQAEMSYALFRQSLRGMRVRDLMTPDPEIVDPYRTVSSFIDEVAHARGHSTYPVVEHDDVVGLVSLRLAAQVPFEQRATTYVRDVMMPRDEVPRVDPDAEIMNAVPELQTGPGRAVAVANGRLAGILSMSDVARAIELEQLRSPAGATTARGSRKGLVLVAIIIIAGLAYLYHPPLVVVAPGPAIDVTQDIEIEGVEVTEVNGGYLLTAVAVSQPNVYGLVAALVRGQDTAPLAALIPPGVDPDEYLDQQRELFRESQMFAAAAAARAAGMDVGVSGTGAVVLQVLPGTPAAEALEEGDVITAINGESISLADDAVRTIRGRPPGSQFDLQVDRDGETVQATVQSQDAIAEGEPGIGVLIGTRDFDVTLPFEVTFRERRVGGPSAGVAYALAVYDMLHADDIAGGRTIASTGTIDFDGRVGRVGGVGEKAQAAEAADADLFLVPEAEVQDARGFDVDVRGVTSLEQAIGVLQS